MPALERALEKGCDPNGTGSDGSPWLYWLGCCSAHPVEATRLLLAHGADPNGHKPGGMSMLHIAAMTGKEQVARLLLEHGAGASPDSHRLDAPGPSG